MSSSTETTYYMELQPGDAVQDGDQWLDSLGRWQPYRLTRDACNVRDGAKARRPIRTSHQTAYEEVPGSRTTQQAIDQPQRERIAYEELQPGDVIQEGDEWRNEDGRWQPFTSLTGSRVQVRHTQRARRPYNITQLQDERDKLRAEMDIAKGDRMNLREALAAEQRAHKVTMTSGLQACKQRDEARAERDRLQEVVGNLYSEPTARQVQQMLRTWATELDWSAGCFDSVGRDEIDTIQKTLVAVIERIESIINPEGGTDDN